MALYLLGKLWEFLLSHCNFRDTLESGSVPVNKDLAAYTTIFTVKWHLDGEQGSLVY